MSRLSLTLVAILMVLGGCDRAATDGVQDEGGLAGDKASLAGEIDRSYAGELMPAFTVSDPEGRELNLGALQGQPVLLNLWATWCAPCIKEMPLLDALAEERDGTLRIITVSQDRKGAEAVVPFLAKRDFSMLEPWLDPESRLESHFGGGLPTTVLYDASGREVWRIAGDYDWSSAEAAGAIEEGLE